MYLLKALRPDVNDALTGEPMPEEGVKREILLPPDHYAERTGDISINKIDLKPDASSSAADARTGRSGKGSSVSAT